MALLPIFATEILRVGARGLSLLAAAPAVGSVLTARVMARLGTLRRQGAVVIGAVVVYGGATVAFGLSRVFWFSLLMLAVMGAADTVSTVLRQTIRQLSTPNYLRGRMTSVNMIFLHGRAAIGRVGGGRGRFADGQRHDLWRDGRPGLSVGRGAGGADGQKPLELRRAGEDRERGP